VSVKLYIDVAPLHEREYTGIPHVAAKLCEELLGDPDVEPGFFYNRHEIPLRLVQQLVAERTGTLFSWAVSRYCFQPIMTPPQPGWRTLALHTNIKTARRIFPVEGQIIHDLTTIVTPQYHTAGTNASHQPKFYGDLLSNDVIFAVSESTALDVSTFYPETRDIPLIVSHLGVDWTHIDPAVRGVDLDTESYVLVLGTIEPRKNIAIVLDLLQKRPEIARMHRMVFGGRIGWGDAFEKQLAARGLHHLLDNGRIVQTGFVSEQAKYLLLKQATAVIYPSVYEGFGLPVAEAISLGTPVVTTYSSSIPEVGREFAFYFRPEDVDGLNDALSEALSRGRREPAPRGPLDVIAQRLRAARAGAAGTGARMVRSRSGETLQQWLDYFSWARCYRTVKEGLLAAAERREAACSC